MNGPRVSIVVPVHGRWGLTAQLLELLADQPMEAEAELIVVDDASPDGSATELAALGRHVGRLPLRVVSHPENVGFASACNSGADVAEGELLVFLNNDTLPEAGWLDELVGHTDRHPGAAVVGAKLLHVDGTVQHAGVVIGQDRNPHHVYAGFPGDHPAVTHHRRMQVVTGACMLVRTEAFAAADGFDTAFRNGHEDVDLCLRLGELGHEVHYCAGAVLVHLESASRGRRTAESAANGRLYRRRWADRVQPDDLGLYTSDGLLTLSYGDTHPLRMRVSPLLAAIPGQTRRRATERHLTTRAAQVADLLRELVDATVARVDPAPGLPVHDEAHPLLGTDDPADDDDLIDALEHLRAVIAHRTGETCSQVAGRGSHDRRIVRDAREAVIANTPAGSVVAVVSRGDDDLLDLDDRTGWHLPRTADGRWAGHHPADSDDAIAAVVTAWRDGATHVAVPTASRWWLDQYRGLATWLRSTHRVVAETDACVVVALCGDAASHRTTAADDTIGSLRDEIADLRRMTTVSQVEVIRRLDALSTGAAAPAAAGAFTPAPAAPAPAAPAAPAAPVAPALDRQPRMTMAEYALLVTRIRALVRTVVPPRTVVAVISRGDDALLNLDDRTGWHLPQADDGRYAGYHPADDAAAIEDLEALRRRGARFLVIPRTSMWWLTYYPGFHEHLQTRYRTLVRRDDACAIFALDRMEDTP